MTVKIAPSLLACDFARLGEEMQAVEAAGANWHHVDVMDGHFVPNISFGQPLVKTMGKVASIPLDVHLMVHEPDPYLAEFAALGAAVLTVHVEAVKHLHRTLGAIKELGVKAGVALNPATPLSSLKEVLDEVDLVCLMSVNPGFGGQKFIEGTVDKTRRLRQMLGERPVEIEIDGGVGEGNASRLIEAGASVLVAGTSVFGKADFAAAIASLRS